ncbi:hypothetical protein HELRODRAFT_73503 [Helobdella robusta]|uniref:RWD domain-containing protein n=1 Tax=Helobdella robusta TaxID=6412 RepID=T1G1E8_HELRO|nr:hypothetical protein HELRODRAFT_73503 [Helobdella robusta]ESO09248.1 hypothetical protein HELRODRAFT_73503 [Helobdella robusta]
MGDLKEDQSNELEVLESIYTNELTIISREPLISFLLTIATQIEKVDMEDVEICLKFTLPENYPDEVPAVEIISHSNLEESYVEVLTEMIIRLAEENVGTVMTYNIVTALQDKLIEIVETVATNKRDEEDRKLKAAEEAERKKFEGTKVTVESFFKWKTKFDAEMMELKKLKIKDDLLMRKLTGRELFMKDHAMDDSDVKFLEEGGEVVEVDETLFQDVDDLDLNGEEEEMDRKLILLDDD